MTIKEANLTQQNFWISVDYLNEILKTGKGTKENIKMI